MNLKRLNLLVAVVEQGGYLAAGEHAHIAHSAVHRQIKLLEYEVGESVLVRHGRGVQLTEVGALLVVLAKRMNALAAESRAQIDDLRELKAGRLRLGTGTTTLIYFLRDVLDRFRNAYPEIELSVTTGSADEILEALAREELDLGVISEPPEGAAAERGLTYRRLYRERFVFVAMEGHPLLQLQSPTWSDLAGERLICLVRGTRVRGAIDQLLARCGGGLNVSMELENEEAIEKMVELGFGLGVIAARRLPGSRLQALPASIPGIDIEVSAVTPTGYTPRRSRVFTDFCLAHTKALSNSEALKECSQTETKTP